MLSIPPAPPAAATAAAPELRPATVVRWKLARWVARALLGGVIAAWGVLLLAWLILHWGILPHIQQWRAPIEARASAALGVPVRIGTIAVQSSGWVPSLELHEVTLLDPQQRVVLRLPRVYAAVSPRSLLSLRLRFEQLLIDGAQLEVRRDAAGHVWVAGLDLSARGASDPGASDWFFAQHEFVVRAGTLRWTDEQRQVEPVVLSGVDLVVRNSLRRHDVHLEATPPAQWGDRFSATARFTQPLLAHDGDWHQWSGSAYLDLPRADVGGLHRYIDLPFELTEGVGALRAWIDVVAGQPHGATVDLALRATTLRLAADVEPLHVQELEGRLIGAHTSADVALELQHLTFLTGDGERWPQGDMKLHWHQPSGQPAGSGGFTAQRLDVGVLAHIASRVPLGPTLRRMLVELNPRATVNDLSGSWTGAPQDPTRYQVRAQVRSLSLDAHPSDTAHRVGRPGLHGANAQIEATETGGHAQLTMNGGEVDLPGVFEDPQLPLDQLSALLSWHIEPTGVAGQAPRVSVQLAQAHASNVDASADLTAQWATGAAPDARLPGHLTLDAKLGRAPAARVARYLPQSLPQATRQYVEHAVRSGTIDSATFHVKGDLAEFPYFGAARAAPASARAAGGEGDGEFRINAHLQGVELAYVPSAPALAGAPAFDSPWPAVTGASVDLALDRGTLELHNGQATLDNVRWDPVQASVRNLGGDAVLTLDAAAHGPVAEMLRFVRVTPVGGWLSKSLDVSTATGAADLQFTLALPLAHHQDTTIKGALTLQGNDLRITADTPLLADSRGRVDFSQRGFALVGTTARLFGGEVALDGGSQPDGAVRFNAQGRVSADGLRRATELGPLARAAVALSGQCEYRASLAFVHGATELNVTSTLQGLGLDLPAPLKKAPDAALALHVQSVGDPGSVVAGRVTRDTIKVELGNLVQAQYQRDLSAAVPRVLRGGIGVMEPAPEPERGVSASITLPTLLVDEWQTTADRLFGVAQARESGADAGYVPTSIGLRVQDLVVGPRHLTHVSAGLSEEDEVWRANLDADQLNGYVEYRAPPPRGGAGAAGRVYARLSRLSLPKSDAEQMESLLDQQPANIPALDVIVEDFELRGRKLGRLEVVAINRRAAGGRAAPRDWQLSKFNLTVPEATLTASGHWSAEGEASAAAGPKERRAVMDFKLAVSDSGALLERFGTSKAIRGGKGELSGQINWLGSPFELDYASLAGQINVAIESGQFLKVDPGAARLLGVLSLQSLPRRLSLDFRDVFQEGFAFDSITGDVKIVQGVAETNNLRMRGVQAVVLMDGSADIAHETQDLRVVVVPEISAATAALAYAVINPAIGLGAFLAQAILNKPLAEANTREFHVSGSWSDPKVERVEHNAKGVLPAGAAAAASAPTNP